MSRRAGRRTDTTGSGRPWPPSRGPEPGPGKRPGEGPAVSGGRRSAGEEVAMTAPRGRLGPAAGLRRPTAGGRPRRFGGTVFEKSPHLALLYTGGDAPLDWLRAGQGLEHVLLEATTAGLAGSLTSHPLENDNLRTLARDPGLRAGVRPDGAAPGLWAARPGHAPPSRPGRPGHHLSGRTTTSPTRPGVGARVRTEPGRRGRGRTRRCGGSARRRPSSPVPSGERSASASVFAGKRWGEGRTGRPQGRPAQCGMRPAGRR